MMKFVKIFTINLFVLFLILVISVIVAEIIIRTHIYIQEPSKNMWGDLFSLSWENFDSQYDNISIIKNKEGNEIFTFRKPSVKDVSNDSIIIAGCSFTFGCGLNYNDTFGVLLSDYTGKNVYNLGINGASPREFLYILRDNYVLNKVLFPKPQGKIKYVIYTYIGDQTPRLYSNVYRKSPEFKLKNNGELVYHKEHSFILKSCFWHRLSSFISYKLISEKQKNKLLNIYFAEINKEIHKVFGPYTKFVIIEFYGSNNNYKMLEDQGVKIIYINELVQNKNLGTSEYTIENDMLHPNRKAWEYIVPLIVKKLELI